MLTNRITNHVSLEGMDPKLIKWTGTPGSSIGLLSVMQSNKIQSFACSLLSKLPEKYIKYFTFCILNKCLCSGILKKKQKKKNKLQDMCL